MLLNRYRPKSLSEIVGQDFLVDALLKWHKSWEKGKALLIWGPTGSGKSAAVIAFAKDKNLDLIELSTSDERNIENVEKFITASIKQRSLFDRGKLIFIDDVDCFGHSDDDFVKAIIEIVEQSSYPVVMTATNAYERKIRTLLPHCKQIQLKRIHELFIERKLKSIVEKEKLNVSPQLIRQIAKESEGDMRAALIDLELCCKAKSFEGREKEKGIFDLLKLFFRVNSLEEGLKLIELSEKDLDELLLWVEENICKEYSSKDERAMAFDILSRIDLFKGKIRSNQNYRYRIYMRNLLASMPLHVKSRSKFTLYNVPGKISLLSSSKASRAENEKVYENLSQILHCSKKIVKNQMPYLNIILK